MKLLSVFRKSLKEQIRDYWTLVLVLSIAPFFVILYWLILGGGSTTYGIAILNKDQGIHQDDVKRNFGKELAVSIKSITYIDKTPILKISDIKNQEEAETKIKNRSVSLLMIIPEDFSQVINSYNNQEDHAGSHITIVGDASNAQYAVAVAITSAALDHFTQQVFNEKHPVQITEKFLGGSASRTEFENYVPGLLLIAIMMLIFPTAMMITREVEAGTLRRLKLTKMTSFDFLSGISLLQILTGIVAVILTFLTSLALGFSSQGPLSLAILIGIITSLSVVGVGLIVACFSKSAMEAFVIGNFPLMLFMFFSGAVFPLPKVSLFTIAGHSIGLYDFLPPTHAIVALNKVLSLGSGLGDIAYELTFMVALSAIFFVTGVLLFKRKHLSA
ncbi:MAG: ABC transporter permease [Actinobacteria bacterium]|nr:ABC transporter permease [Actinomycetota bacterium]